MNIHLHLLMLVTSSTMLCTSASGQLRPSTPDEWSRLNAVFDRDRELRDQVITDPSTRQAAFAAQVAGDEALAMIHAGDYGNGHMGRSAASLLNRTGQQNAAAIVLRAVADNPETPHDKVDSLRQLGQLYYTQPGGRHRAEETFREAYEYGIAHWDLGHETWSRSFINSTFSLSRIYRSSGRDAQAEEIYTFIASKPQGTFPPVDDKMALLGIAKVRQEAQDTDAVEATLVQLFDRYPEFGISEKSGVTARIKHLEFLDPELKSDEYAATLERMWNEHPDTPDGIVLMISQRLADAYLRRHEFEAAMTVRVEAVDRLRATDSHAKIMASNDRFRTSGIITGNLMAALNNLINDARQYDDPELGLTALIEADALYQAAKGERFPGFDKLLERFSPAPVPAPK